MTSVKEVVNNTAAIIRHAITIGAVVVAIALAWGALDGRVKAVEDDIEKIDKIETQVNDLNIQTAETAVEIGHIKENQGKQDKKLDEILKELRRPQ